MCCAVRLRYELDLRFGPPLTRTAGGLLVCSDGRGHLALHVVPPWWARSGPTRACRGATPTPHAAMPRCREKALVDAEFYKQGKAAEANQHRLTPEYLELTRLQSLTQTTKIYFGPDIPSFFHAIGDASGGGGGSLDAGAGAAGDGDGQPGAGPGAEGTTRGPTEDSIAAGKNRYKTNK